MEIDWETLGFGLTHVAQVSQAQTVLPASSQTSVQLLVAAITAQWQQTATSSSSSSCRSARSVVARPTLSGRCAPGRGVCHPWCKAATRLWLLVYLGLCIPSQPAVPAADHVRGRVAAGERLGAGGAQAIRPTTHDAQRTGGWLSLPHYSSCSAAARTQSQQVLLGRCCLAPWGPHVVWTHVCCTAGQAHVLSWPTACTCLHRAMQTQHNRQHALKTLQQLRCRSSTAVCAPAHASHVHPFNSPAPHPLPCCRSSTTGSPCLRA